MDEEQTDREFEMSFLSAFYLNTEMVLLAPVIVPASPSYPVHKALNQCLELILEVVDSPSVAQDIYSEEYPQVGYRRTLREFRAAWPKVKFTFTNLTVEYFSREIERPTLLRLKI